MEDPLAAIEGGTEAVVVQNVGTAQGQPLISSLQGMQVDVLAVRFT